MNSSFSTAYIGGADSIADSHRSDFGLAFALTYTNYESSSHTSQKKTKNKRTDRQQASFYTGTSPPLRRLADMYRRLLPITESGLLTVVNKLSTNARRNFSKVNMSLNHLPRERATQRLLEKGPDVECRSNDGQTPLWWAAEKGYETVVKLLLEKGADVESKDNDDNTPLLLTAEKGHEAVVKLLLEKGADVESKTRYHDHTPLSFAARNGHEAVVKLLLDKGADVESKSRFYGFTPLLMAAWKGHEAVVTLLLEKGADVESRSDSGQTPLLWAAEYGHEAVMKLLLEKGAESLLD
jgi:ankyrin repeat protein